jgi:hypothetical protein
MANGIFDPTERFLDWDEATRQDQEAHQSRIWTALPVVIGKHIPDKMTVEAQPSVQLAVRQSGGQIQWRSIPAAEDMPLLYLGGGGAVITNPVKQGDEGLVVYSSRSIDNWWQNGGVQPQFDNRMHSLSDGFVIPGFRSQAKKLSNISQNTWQLRTEDGKTYLELDPTKGQFKIVSPNHPTVIMGDLQVSGKITAGGDVLAGLPPSSSTTEETAEPQSGAGAIPSTPGAVIGAALNAAEQAVGTWRTITNGSFQVPINNVLQQVTGLNFSAIQNLGDVANTITAGLGLAGSMNWSPLGQTFGLASATVGINSVVGFLSAIPGIGTDISGLLKMTSSLGTLVPGLRGTVSLLEHLHQLVRTGPNNTGDPT